uniref:Uncharacterized protein n=1 Tax=uncultured bacterium fosmid pJB69A5 TaxID=1478067 RepID=A0A0H3UAI3_9BACT|nr:hypothetical protein [uncultured bacterium fosmid pJB69A5]
MILLSTFIKSYEPLVFLLNHFRKSLLDRLSGCIIHFTVLYDNNLFVVNKFAVLLTIKLLNVIDRCCYLLIFSYTILGILLDVAPVEAPVATMQTTVAKCRDIDVVDVGGADKGAAC